MWTLNWSFKNNAVDEFESDNQRKNPRMNNAIGFFLPSGFCVIGLYWFFIPQKNYINQYLIVVGNNALGVWYDEDADLYQTRQWQIWNSIRKLFV